MAPLLGTALAYDEGEDEEVVKQETLHQTNDLRVPLQVIPKEQVYSVPQVFGLDECFYRWDAGSRLAARAQARLMQDIGRKQAEVSKRPATAQENTRHSSDMRGSKEILGQPGTSGSALILWNLNKGISTDFGASQVRKRRQKVTDDLLREIMVSLRDPLALVSWWFRVFEHYADPPEAFTLPALPERREEDWFGSGSGEESPTSSPVLKRGSSTTSLGGRRTMCASSGSSCCAQPGRMMDRPASSLGSCPRPRLRGARSSSAADSHRRKSVDREKCQQRRIQLHRNQAARLQAFGSDVDLCQRLRQEEVDEQTFVDWRDAFQQAVKLPARNFPGKFQSKNVKNARRDTALGDVTKLFSAKLHDRFILGKNSFQFGDGSSSSATCSEEDLDLAAHLPHSEEPDILGASANEVMLQCSSLALLDSQLMRSESLGGPEKKNTSYEEVSRTRKKILANMVPVEMSLSNLATVLLCFGMQRKPVDRVAKYLLLGVASPTWRGPSDANTLGEQVPFEVFYRLMRALQGDTNNNSVASDSSPREPSTAMEAWLDSELLRRLVYTSLTDHAATSYRLGATDRRRADDRQFPILYSTLFESFRIMLCPELFYELQYRTLIGEHASDIGEHHASGVGFDVQLNSLTEFLLCELHSAETGGNSSAAQAYRECNFKLYGSQSPTAGSEPAGISYHGFERFVARWPGVFVDLLRVLMPLAEHGARFVAEEMHLAQKNLMHRAGELQAKVAVQTPRYQRRQIEKLYATVKNEARSGRAKV